jgi:hypothetical protein
MDNSDHVLCPMKCLVQRTTLNKMIRPHAIPRQDIHDFINIVVEFDDTLGRQASKCEFTVHNISNPLIFLACSERYDLK